MDVYFCFLMFVISMHDGISQSFTKRQLDIELVSRNTLRLFNERHQTVHHR